MSQIMRAIVRQSDGTTKCQNVQITILADEVREDVEVFEPAGLSVRPMVDAEVLALAVNGDENHLIAIGTAGRDQRPTDVVQPGEGGLYFAGEYKVFMKADGTVLLGASDATEMVALANLVASALAALKSAISGAGTTPGDGGAAFKAAIMAALNGITPPGPVWPPSVAATLTKAK